MKLSAVSILFILISLDYITGVIVALYEKKANSTIGRKGIFRKVGIIICIFMCELIDLTNLKGFDPLLPMITLFFICNESLSILENLNKLNVPIPSTLANFLKNNKRND